jgi:hypothetical protein
LRDRVDLAVGAAQLGHQQHAAAQALGIAHRRHGDVDLLTDLQKGRQIGGDHRRGNRGRLQKGRGLSVRPICRIMFWMACTV